MWIQWKLFVIFIYIVTIVIVILNVNCLVVGADNNALETILYVILILFFLVVTIGLFTEKYFIGPSECSATDFRGSDLTYADFNCVRFNGAIFEHTVLTGTSWQGAQGLRFVYCNGTILDDWNVRELMVHGRGEGQSFKGKNLSGAYLAEANLRNTDLRETDLMQANLSGADITGTKLYGSARENWIIDGIRCDYVCWDEAGKLDY